MSRAPPAEPGASPDPGADDEQALSRERARVLVDGVESAAVSPLDRGLHFGDGLFETIACIAGRPRFLALHLERLLESCARLRITPDDPNVLRAEVETLAREGDRSIVKLLVTRGTALERGYGPVGREKAMRITIRYAWPPEQSARLHDGARVRTLRLRLGENPLLAGMKHCNRLEQILAREECAGSDVDEGLLFSSSGQLVSGTMSNIFLVSGSALLTPRLDRCGVAGVMRRVILREAARAGIAVRESVLGEAQLLQAEEAFLTNARVGIWPVRMLDDRALKIGSITRQLQDRMRPLLDEPADG